MEMNNLNGDNKMNKTVLVTGGAGFIGSHVVERHLNEGNAVVVVDDLSMGLLKNPPENDNLTFFEKSITDTTFMNDLLVKYNFDYIYLLAAIASVADTIERPYESHQVNQEANIAILESLRINNLRPHRILFSSSAATYGTLPDLPKREDGPVRPATAYAIDKYATERFVLTYSALYDLPAVAVRFFQESIYNSYDKIVFISEGGKNGFMSKFPQVNTDKTIIHNVIDSREIQNKSLIVDDNYSEWLRLTDNTFRVISVGRADPVKRFDLLIEAFKNAAESTVIPLSLTIIGDGSYFNNLKDIVDKNNLSNVFLLGMKSNPMPYVKSSDLFVNSSRVESYPTVIGEALVLGVPVLATKNGGSEEILEDGRFGELIENTGDVSTLSANVLGAVNNVKDLKSKALSAQSHFSMAKVLNEYTRLIDKVSVDRNTLKNE